MVISLKGKKALVGGSSRGIGKAIAIQLAESGASVTVMARNEKRLKSLISQLPQQGEQAHRYLVIDFSDLKSYKDTITSYIEQHTIDILINNTQGPKAGSSLEMNSTDYQEAFDAMFHTIVLTTKLVLKQMIKKGWGRVINVASISVKEPLSYLALSNTVRAAVVTWAKTLATEVAPHGITVNNVLTGYFDTERIKELNNKKAEQLGIKPAEVRQTMIDQVPMNRIGDPSEYASLVAFLASDKASYLTGSNIPLDGGLLRSM